MIEIILLKGLFYFKLFSHFYSSEVELSYLKLSAALDRCFQKMDYNS